MKSALRAFTAGVFTGAALLYVLMWHLGEVAAPDLGIQAAPRRAPAVAQIPRAGLPQPQPPVPSAPPSREPGDSTDDLLQPHNPFAPPPDPLASPPPAPGDLERLKDRLLSFPVEGFDLARLRDNFAEMRGTRVHEAIDMMAARGTPVRSVDEGVVKKIFVSARGGMTVYAFDPSETFCYYYAHLDRYAEGLHEGQVLKKGDLIGYVGTSGNAPPNAPHLHFTIFKLGPKKNWWEGTAINPFPLWALR